MTALDRRTDKRNLVLDATGTSERPAARLKVDQKHPFFFDHPLDHVPGLLLLEGAVQLAQMHAKGRKYVHRIEANFLKYALFDDPIVLSAQIGSKDERQTFSINVEQAGSLRSCIRVELAEYHAPAIPSLPDRDNPIQPCPRKAVNKLRSENVLIGTPRIAPPGIEADILPPHPDCLMSDSARILHPLYLLEAFMQMQRYLNRVHQDRSRMRDILTGVGFTRIAPITYPVATPVIRGTTDFVETAPKRLSRSATIQTGGHSFAECTLCTAAAGQYRKSA